MIDDVLQNLKDTLEYFREEIKKPASAAIPELLAYLQMEIDRLEKLIKKYTDGEK